jgi:hypothetical protein
MRCNYIILVLFQDLHMFRLPVVPIIRSSILQLADIGITYITLDREVYGNVHFNGCLEWMVVTSPWFSCPTDKPYIRVQHTKQIFVSNIRNKYSCPTYEPDIRVQQTNQIFVSTIWNRYSIVHLTTNQHNSFLLFAYHSKRTTATFIK